MKIYLPILSIQKIEIDPFKKFKKWWSTYTLWKRKRKLKKYYKKQNWNQNDIWRMTRGCGSLDDAINTLAHDIVFDFEIIKKDYVNFSLLRKKKLLNYIKNIIEKDFEEDKFK